MHLFSTACADDRSAVAFVDELFPHGLIMKEEGLQQSRHTFDSATSPSNTARYRLLARRSSLLTPPALNFRKKEIGVKYDPRFTGGVQITCTLGLVALSS